MCLRVYIRVYVYTSIITVNYLSMYVCYCMYVQVCTCARAMGSPRDWWLAAIHNRRKPRKPVACSPMRCRPLQHLLLCAAPVPATETFAVGIAFPCAAIDLALASHTPRLHVHQRCRRIWTPNLLLSFIIRRVRGSARALRLAKAIASARLPTPHCSRLIYVKSWVPSPLVRGARIFDPLRDHGTPGISEPPALHRPWRLTLGTDGSFGPQPSP